jgi:hypothetical protein
VTRSITLIGVALLAALVCVPAAFGAWSSPGAGSAYVKARTMPAGNTPTVSRSNRSVTVSWAQSSFSGGPAVSGYDVKRYNSTSGVLQSIGSACNGTIAGLTCTENAVPAGTWRYRVTPRQGLWNGAESANSAAMTVPAPTFTLSAASARVPTTPATVTGTLANYIPGQTVTYRLDSTTGTVLTGSISPTPVQASGSATASVNLPAGVAPGNHTIYAIGSSGDSAVSGTFTVGPAFVKNVGTSGTSCGTTSSTVTVPAAGVALNNTVILRLALRGTTAPAVSASDSRGNTYIVDRDVLNVNQRVVVVHARVTTALVSGDTITVTFPTSTGSALVVDEFHSVAAGAAETSGAGTGTGTAPSASLTTSGTSSTPDLLIGAVSSSGQPTSSNPANWTALTRRAVTCGPLANIGHRRAVSTTGAFTYAPTLSVSGTWAAAVVAYQGG